MEMLSAPSIAERNAGTVEDFAEQLVRANAVASRSINRRTTALDLGVFNSEADQAIERTFTGSQLCEVGKLVRITDSGEVLIPKDFIQGDERQVNIKADPDQAKRTRIGPFNTLGRINRRRPLYSGIAMHTHPSEAKMHSHPESSPPSHPDIWRLLLENKDREAEVAVFVITPRDKYVIFRGPNTPLLNQKKAFELSQEYIDLQNVLINSSSPIFALSFEVYRLLALDQFVREYDLQFFHGDIKDSTVVKKYPADLLKV